MLALCLSLCPVRVLAADPEAPTGGFKITKDTTNTTTYEIKESFLFDTSGHTYTITGQTAISVKSTGRLYLTTGTIKSTKGAGIEVLSGGFVCVDKTDMTVSGTTYGLNLSSGATARLSGGKFTGTTSAIRAADGDYGALLDTGCAYFDANSNALRPDEVSKQKTVSVAACTDHVYDYTATAGAPTHSRTCRYCGASDTEPCTFSFDENGAAACQDECGHTLTVTINTPSGDLVYNGASQPNEVTVTVSLENGKTLTRDADYTVNYTTGRDAGELIAVTVTGKTYNGTFTKMFKVIQDQPVIEWTSSALGSYDYTVDQDALISRIKTDLLSKVTITGAAERPLTEALKGFLEFSYRVSGSDAGFTKGLPTDAGTYEIKASLPETQNYKGAESQGITLTINKVSPVVDVPLGKELTYNGTAQALVTGGKVLDGAVILFAESENGPWSTDIPKETNAGLYEVWYKVEETRNYNSVVGMIFPYVEIQRKIETGPAANLLTYNGTAQGLITAATATTKTSVDTGAEAVVVEYAMSANGSYSTDFQSIKATDAGSYEVWYRVRETDNYFGTAAAKVDVTISPKPVTPAVTLSQTSYTYDGTAKEPVVTVKDGNDVIPASEYTVAYSDNINAGQATVTVTDRAGGNYTFNTVKEHFTIIAGNSAVLTSTPQAVPGLTYNGQAQNLVTVGTATGGSLVYAWKAGNAEPADSEYTSNIPKGTDAGEYKVYYKVRGDGNHTDTEPAWVFVTIQPKTVSSPVIELANKTFTYNGSAQTFSDGEITVKDGTDIISATEYTVTYSSNINAGTATVHINDKSGGNYTVNGTAYFTIAKKTVSPTITLNLPGPYVYTGSAITPGVTVVDNADSKEIPATEYTVTYSNNINAGTATVTVKSVDGGNYVISTSDTFTIGKASVDTAKVIAPTAKTGLTYNGAAQGLIARGYSPDGAVVYRLGETGNYSEDIPTAVAAGAYTVYYMVRGDSNHNDGAAASVTVSIEKAEQAPLTVFSMTGLIYYGDSFTLTAIGGSGTGAVTWKSSDPNVAAITENGGLVEVRNSGTVTITATKAGSDNYKEATATWTLNALPKPVTATVTAENKTYDGGTDATLHFSWMGVINGDTISTSGVTGMFEDKNVGTGKTVTISGSITDTRYAVTLPGTTTASITQAQVEWEAGAGPTAPSGLVPAGSSTPLISGVATKNNLGVMEYALVGINDENPNTYQIGAYADLVIDGDDDDVIVIPDDYYNEGPPDSWYSTGIPTAANLSKGTYRVWYKIADDESGYGNWKGIAPAWVEVEIGEATSSTPPASSPSQTPGSGSTPSTGTDTTPPAADDEPGTETASMETTVQNGTASTVVNGAAADELVDEAVANQSEAVVIRPEIDGDVTRTEVSLPASAVGRLGSETDAALTVSTPVADVTIPNAALEMLSGAGDTVSVVMERVENTVVLALTADGEALGDIPGGLTLTVPAEDAGPGTVAVLVYEDGTRETIRWSVAADGAVRIPLDGSATVEIVDNSKEFSDVSGESWAADAVAFASAHELFSGTGKTTFSPERLMSRGMLATVLYNLEGRPDQDLTDGFSDVGGDDWYAAGVSWAAANGITGGYGNGRFGPNDSVTREQFVVMLWRYAGSPEADGQTLDCTDADRAGSYAVAALCWAVESGILRGYGDGRLDPGGVATRAQAAQILKNFIENS